MFETKENKKMYTIIKKWNTHIKLIEFMEIKVNNHHHNVTNMHLYVEKAYKKGERTVLNRKKNHKEKLILSLFSTYDFL